MTKRVKLSKWAETAFQNDWELWRTRTNEGMDEGGRLTHISQDEALWLTLDLAPEKLGCI